MRMPFGKYKGSGVEDIPTSYLLWMTRKLKRNFQLMAAEELEKRGIILNPPLAPPKPILLSTIELGKPGRLLSKGHAALEKELTQRLLLDDLKDAYNVALKGSVQGMAEACEIIREEAEA